MKPWGKRRAAGAAAFAVLTAVLVGTGPAARGENGDMGQYDAAPNEFRMVIDPGDDAERSVAFRTEEATGEASDKESSCPPGDDGNGYRLSLALQEGYRHDTLVWNIADIDNAPNILSELEWEDVESGELSGTLRWDTPAGICFRGSGSFGWVLDGKTRDSDYLGNDRTYEFSRSYADTKDGYMYDAVLGEGYCIPLSLGAGRMNIIPMGGYSWHGQKFEVTNGNQVLAAYILSDEALGPYGGLESVYRATWHGPWAGLDLELASGSGRVGLTASFEYHWAEYEGEANWNLRDDLAHPVSFRHEADGEGIMASLNYRCRISDRWHWTLGGSYRSMSTDPGTDTTYLYNGITVTTRLNEVEWESYSVSIGFGYKF